MTHETYFVCSRKVLCNESNFSRATKHGFVLIFSIVLVSCVVIACYLNVVDNCNLFTEL